MTTSTFNISPRTISIAVGVGLLASILGVVLVEATTNSLIVAGDAQATARNIIASQTLFRFGISGWVIAILGDMARAWGLYVFLKRVNSSVALLSVWFMLVHDAIFAASLVNLFFASALPSGAGLSTVFDPGQLQALGMLAIDGFEYGFSMGLFFFSFHLGLVGYLAYRSGYVPKILGVLMMAAFLSYLIDAFFYLFMPVYPETLDLVLMLPKLIGEMAIALWITFRAGKVLATLESA